MPAQVPIDERNTAKGVGALAAGGWSVATVNCPKWASTREPPGKSMIISMCDCSCLFFLAYYTFDVDVIKKLHFAENPLTLEYLKIQYWEHGSQLLLIVPGRLDSGYLADYSFSGF